MLVPNFLKLLQTSPETIRFEDTIATIDAAYIFTPTAFTNHETYNEAGQNSGSCKLFAFAKLQQLSQRQTLLCFGAYYRDDVLGNPQCSNHQNIRNFMKAGWDGIVFEAAALKPKH